MVQVKISLLYSVFLKEGCGSTILPKMLRQLKKIYVKWLIHKNGYKLNKLVFISEKDLVFENITKKLNKFLRLIYFYLLS